MAEQRLLLPGGDSSATGSPKRDLLHVPRSSKFCATVTIGDSELRCSKLSCGASSERQLPLLGPALAAPYKVRLDERP